VHATPLLGSPAHDRGSVRDGAAIRGNRGAVLVGVLAVLVSLAGSWTPSYWSDEVATLRAVRLSWPELAAFVEQKDAVHAAYYSVMKLWVGVFGESELATRSLSAIAVGAGAAGLVVLVTRMTGTRVGILAGLIFAVLPRTTAMGLEARSFALSAACVVWMTVVLLVAARTGRWRWWAGYAALSAAGTYLFLYSLLILAAHAVFLLSDRRGRRVFVSWSVAAAAAVVATVPLLLVSVGQKEQIAWLADQPVVNAWTILVEPAFDSSWLVAALGWGALLVLAVRFRTIRTGPHASLFSLAAVWFSVPPLLLLAADTLIGPLYTARYLSVTVAATAVLLAMAFTISSRAALTWILLAVLVLANAPTYIAQRGPFAKNGGSDLAQIADYIHSHAAEGDGLYLQDTGSVTLRPRQALYAYPAAFAATADIAFVAPLTSTGTFSDRTRALEETGPALAGVDRVWVVTAGTATSDAAREAEAVLRQLGFSATGSQATNRSLITLFER
jgi:mannosyltransferase